MVDPGYLADVLHVIGNIIERRTGLWMNRDILRVLRVVVVVSQLAAAARLGEPFLPGIVLLPPSR